MNYLYYILFSRKINNEKIFFHYFIVVLVITLHLIYCPIIYAEGNYLNSPRIIRIGLELFGKTELANITSSNEIIEIQNSSKKIIYSGKGHKLKVTAKPKGNILFEINEKKILASNSAIISNKNPRTATLKLSAPSKYSKEYRGKLEVKLSGFKLYWLNLVDLEDYLKSVVPSEISTRAPKSAIEAQTIAARTYAIRNLDRHIQKSGYNLCDTIHCQAYFGISKEYKSSNSAVKATEGKILVFANTPANTVYHSNCGGYIISSQTAWGGKNVPYLIGHYDGIKGEKSFCEFGKSYLSKQPNIVLPEKSKRLVIGVTSGNSKKKTHSNFGHRVGMCQDGAIGMAAIGYSCSNILGFYYPKTKIETLKYASNNNSNMFAPTKVTTLAELKQKDNNKVTNIQNTKNTVPLDIKANTDSDNKKIALNPQNAIASSTQELILASTNTNKNSNLSSIASASNIVKNEIPNKNLIIASATNVVKNDIPNKNLIASASNNVKTVLPDKALIASATNVVKNDIPSKTLIASATNVFKNDIPNKTLIASATNVVKNDLPNKILIASATNVVKNDIPNKTLIASATNVVKNDLPNKTLIASASNVVKNDLPNKNLIASATKVAINKNENNNLLASNNILNETDKSNKTQNISLNINKTIIPAENNKVALASKNNTTNKITNIIASSSTIIEKNKPNIIEIASTFKDKNMDINNSKPVTTIINKSNNSQNKIIIASVPKDEKIYKKDLSTMTHLSTNDSKNFINKPLNKTLLIENDKEVKRKNSIRNIIKEISITKPNPTAIVLKEMYQSPANTNISKDLDWR